MKGFVRYIEILYFHFMDLKAQLLTKYSKDNNQLIANYIGMNAKKYRLLWDLVKEGEKGICQRASWAMGHCAFSYSPKIQVFIPEMIAEIKNPVHVAVKRNVMKILSEVDEIPEDLSAAFFDLCIDWIIDKHTSIAVKVYAMEVAAKIAMPYKELRDELKMLFEEQLKHGSAGVKVRARRLIKQMSVI